MKKLLFPLLILLAGQSIGQIAFQEIISPDDLSIKSVRKSPIGEYFLQASNDPSSVYSSLNGHDWTKHYFPDNTSLEDIVFFNDGTPLIQPDHDEHIIRRNGSWQTISTPGGKAIATFTKGDTLFAYSNQIFSYSLNKGISFTTAFEAVESIVDHTAHLWKFDHYYVLHHTAGASDNLSIFDLEGNRVMYHFLDVSSAKFYSNECSQALITDYNSYYLLKEEGLALLSGSLTSIHPDLNGDNDLIAQNGNYYVRIDSNVYKSNGCNFNWEHLTSHELLETKNNFWINFNEDILLFDINEDLYIENLAGTQTWFEHIPDIDYALVLSVIESPQEHQVVLTTNSLFTKSVSEPNWIPLDSNIFFGLEAQYSPDGDLYVNRGNDLLHSPDNGENFITIDIPDGEFNNTSYRMSVLDNDIIFLWEDFFGESYYTIDNGIHWLSAPLFTSGLSRPLIKLSGNYIVIFEGDYYFDVTWIDIVTNEIYTKHLGDFFNLNYYGMSIQDDGTIYFQAFDTNGAHPEGLYRYRLGHELEFIGQFPELEYVDPLLSSGYDLFAFESQAYHVFDGNYLTTHSYTGLPASGSKYFQISGNEYLYVIIDGHRIFRSTKPLSYPKHITGSVLHELNDNCVPDSTNHKLSHWQLTVEGQDYLRIGVTDQSGNFNFSVPDGTLTISCVPISSQWGLCEEAFNILIDETQPNVQQNFMAYALNDCAELEVDFSTPLLRRCFDNYYAVRVRNTGPSVSAGTSLVLDLDPFFDNVSASMPFTQVEVGVIKFELGTLDVNEEISFHIYFTLSCNAELGMEHCLTGSIQDDVICGEDRSFYTECQTNIGSFDPNDKRIFNEEGNEVSRVDKGKYIYYHIRFQNTGTDTAFTVRIFDQLSPTLDLTTLEMLSASHPYTFSVADGPLLSVIFNNILLPDSTTNEPASHGYVKFRIKPHSQYEYGTTIPNQAGINFDFNDPVLTNEATLQILSGTKELRSLIDFIVYPNPTNQSLSISIDDSFLSRIDSYIIIDLLGSPIVQANMQWPTSIDVSDLMRGIYVLIVKQNGVSLGSSRFVKL